MRRFLCLLLAFMMAASLLPAVRAYDGPAVSSNINDHFYINVGRWTDPIKSTLYAENGGYVRVEYIDGVIVAERYDDELNYISGQELEMELPVYGGVYIAQDYNFIVTGQNNTEEDDSREVFRITRYSKDWAKIDHASLFGANTIYPFEAGCCRFDRSGDILYIRTCHEMYTTEDGLNHQANVFIALRISDMTITDSFTDILNMNWGYISHSFNQFVRADGDTLLAVDHGDASPRSIVLINYGKKASREQFYGRVTYVDAFPIAEATGHYNDTGVSVGGFECSSSHYLIAGSSCPQDGSVDQKTAFQNIFVTATPKDDFTDEATRIVWLTDHPQADRIRVSPPHFIKLDSDRFILVWTENGDLKYCFLDGNGQLVGEIQSGEGSLSDCVPIADGNRLLWYVTSSSAPVFYEIDITAPHDHIYTSAVTAPTCTEPGYTTHTCSVCSRSYADAYVEPLGHIWELDKCSRCGGQRPNPFTDTKPARFYYIPVLWALDNGITQGTVEGKFSPEDPCTRAQVVTFLWRAADAPDPTITEHPFTDVKPDAFYYKAMLWALEEGITMGTTGTTFGPDVPCDRGTVVTFLHRAKESPAPESENNPFTDVKAGKFYYNAVLWAVEKGITSGTSAAAFDPGEPCTRGQVVTFLHRTFG